MCQCWVSHFTTERSYRDLLFCQTLILLDPSRLRARAVGVYYWLYCLHHLIETYFLKVTFVKFAPRMIYSIALAQVKTDMWLL